ncbi:hypothetical protein F5I97DRAFT_1814089 [Phlebopus sp. FC_14]|nr:hypothetical protein F5I97DRAFT_1814089 [Phlebopus sp. FC_14]
MRSPLCVRSLTSLPLCLATVTAFSVTVGSPTQCGPMSVSWTGGQAPFEIILIPVYSVPRTETVPSTAFSNNQGSYQIAQLPFQSGSKFLLTMSDATGFGTGGTTDVLVVGAAVGNNDCNTTVLSPAFDFSTPSPLQQCSPYVFNQYSDAVLPVTITGLIPGGLSFTLHPDATATSYTWTTDVAAGTSIVFMMSDSQNRSGGVTDVEAVLMSNDNSCLNANSPSSTSSATSTTSPVTTPTATHSSSSSVPVGTIAGAAVGAFVAVAILVALAWFCVRKRRKNSSLYGIPAARSSRRLETMDLDSGGDDFTPAPVVPFPYQTDSVSRLAPPITSSSATTSSPLQGAHNLPASPAHQSQHSRVSSNTESLLAYNDAVSSSLTSSGRRKAAMMSASGSQTPTRFIVHTDAEDVVPADAQLVELPPQYTERRAPLAPQLSSSTIPRATSSEILHPSSDLTYPPGSYVDEPPEFSMHPPPLR